MNNMYFAVKALAENNFMATTADIAKYGMKNPADAIYQLRKRGHTIFTKRYQGVSFYVMPFGPKNVEQKMTYQQRELAFNAI
jgi:hypothetical protein